MGNGGVERLVSGKKLLFLIFSATDEGGWEGEGLVIIFFQEMFIGERVINDSTGIIKVRTLYSTTSSSPSLSFEVPPDYSEQSSPPTSDSAQSPSSPPYQKFAAITSCKKSKKIKKFLSAKSLPFNAARLVLIGAKKTKKKERKTENIRNPLTFLEQTNYWNQCTLMIFNRTTLTSKIRFLDERQIVVTFFSELDF